MVIVKKIKILYLLLCFHVCLCFIHTEAPFGGHVLVGSLDLLSFHFYHFWYMYVCCVHAHNIPEGTTYIMMCTHIHVPHMYHTCTHVPTCTTHVPHMYHTCTTHSSPTRWVSTYIRCSHLPESHNTPMTIRIICNFNCREICI